MDYSSWQIIYQMYPNQFVEYDFAIKLGKPSSKNNSYCAIGMARNSLY